MLFSAALEEWLAGPNDRSDASHCRIVHDCQLDLAGESKRVAFTTIVDGEKHRKACELINSRYGGKGYGSNHVIPRGAHHTTFTAELDGDIVGTITLAIDAGAGLAIDRTFPEEMAAARADAGARVCELIKLASDDGIRSKEVLAGLFHLAFLYGTSVSDCTDLFIEVHQRHASFYEAMLGFERIGPVRVNASVGQPSHLLRLKVASIAERIAAHTGRRDAAAARSLYAFFFSPEEEEKIRQALGVRRPALKSVDVGSRDEAVGADRIRPIRRAA